MTIRIIVRRSAAIIGVGVGVYGFTVYRRLSTVDSSRITTLYNASDTFVNSRTIQEIVNPRHHKSTGDSRATTLTIPPKHQEISDEVLLAQFTKAFFSGRVFAIERFLLANVGYDAGQFTRLPPSGSRLHISKVSQFSDVELPPLNTTIFSLFHIADININSDHPTMTSKPYETISFVDVAFGSDIRRFSGAHRFSIVREGQASERVDSQQGSTKVQISFDSLTCNPVQADAEPKFYSDVLKRFHRVYALLLFRDAVAGVQDWLAQT